MNNVKTLVALAATAMIATSASAGATWPNSNGPMWHVMIDFDGTNVTVDAPENAEPLEMLSDGLSHTAPADVLDGQLYNDQYGWLANGIFTPPTDAAFWIIETAATPGLHTFEGGMRPMRPNHSYAPVFTDNTTPWMWGGTMTHNWYATETLGAQEATYEVYIGDLTGNPLPGFGSDTVTLRWNAVPTPGAAVLLGALGLVSTRRRR